MDIMGQEDLEDSLELMEGIRAHSTEDLVIRLKALIQDILALVASNIIALGHKGVLVGLPALVDLLLILRED